MVRSAGAEQGIEPRDTGMNECRATDLEQSVGGLGIGLTVAKRLVDMHEGSIEAFSDGGFGKGSEFVVRLPVIRGTAKTITGDLSVEPIIDTPRRILIVDDNEECLFLGGATTAEVRPEIILLDIGLPKLNGYDTCRRIREQPWAKNIFIVALTGWVNLRISANRQTPGSTPTW